MDQDIFSLAIYCVLIFTVAAGGLVVSSMVGRRKRGWVKEEPLECGVPQIGPTRTEFNVRFFILAMLFVLFDIETVLLAPYAATFTRDIAEGKGFEYLAEVGIFLAVLGMGLLYAWRKGVLDWNVPLGANPEDAARHYDATASATAAEDNAEHDTHGTKHAA
ncbi:MAG: NADH-quinone oxidoreductase subunit A [Planctomycetes bacterium]|nr:NADH-quinone oxidoreductase subunit A [Planctomycetota bacterium]